MIRSKRILLISIKLMFCYPMYFKHIYFNCNVIITNQCVHRNAKLYLDHLYLAAAANIYMLLKTVVVMMF